MSTTLDEIDTRCHDHIWCPCEPCRRLRLRALPEMLGDPEHDFPRCQDCGGYELWTQIERHWNAKGGTYVEVCACCAQKY